MSYATTANQPKPAAALGAIGVPSALAVLLVTGLAVSQDLVPPLPNPTGTFEEEVIEFTPDPIEPDATQSSSSSSTTRDVPEFDNVRPESDFNFEFGPTAEVGDLTGIGDDLLGTVDPIEFDIPGVRPTPSFDPVKAAPRGNPGEWITDSDYRTVWINRGYSGVASFNLTIDSTGRVSSCAITGSTGYSALDEATCRLLERRARFKPAQDTSGNAVAGTYSSSVAWEIPE